MYDKELRRGKDGKITRYVGQNSRGVPEKFRLGYDMDVAQKRLNLIAALWHEVEHRQRHNGKTFWDEKNLAAAKAIAKGKQALVHKWDYESHADYAQRVTKLQKASENAFVPAIERMYEIGLNDVREIIDRERKTLSKIIGVPNATGRTLKQAVKAYCDHLRKEKTLPNGSLIPWGKTQLDQVDSITGYLKHEKIAPQNFLLLDLAELTLTNCDAIYGLFRKRPLTIRSKLKTRMTPSSAKNLIKVLGNFFDWLDGSEEFNWTIPRRFNSIKKTPEELTPVEKYERKLAKERSIIPDGHLARLNEYAIPSERILLLLGMNCAFGAGEIGQLRMSFLRLDENTIDGIRFKSGNVTKQRLWSQTKDALVWWLREREQIAPAEPDFQSIVFLTERGKPLWHYTDKGNNSDGVSNAWNRLIDRVRDDDEEFPKYSFNKLRKTAATRILRLASAEVASMLLAHKTISDDELLLQYAQLPWEKLYHAQLQLEQELGPFFEAAGSTPWVEPPRTYIGVARTKRLIALHHEGVPAEDIASELNINIATVYRHLRNKIGKRKPGRRPKPR